jgi:hypothetical protein
MPAETDVLRVFHAEGPGLSDGFAESDWAPLSKITK